MDESVCRRSLAPCFDATGIPSPKRGNAGKKTFLRKLTGDEAAVLRNTGSVGVVCLAGQRVERAQRSSSILGKGSQVGRNGDKEVRRRSVDALQLLHNVRVPLRTVLTQSLRVCRSVHEASLSGKASVQPVS